MQLFTRVASLQDFIHQQRERGKSIAFVPTMGALHQGHLSLIASANEKADLCVCSIFVNPSQFNSAEDLVNYPRDLQKDAYQLELAGCEVLFAPSVNEVYPEGLDVTLNLDLGSLDQTMEGHFRPGHFKGMLEVVKRLLDIAQADFLIMGQKDFQQHSLVRLMITQLNLGVKLIIVPTAREADGLAMSSRNKRLLPEFREKAKVIYQLLLHLRKEIQLRDIETLKTEGMETLKSAGLLPEYVEIVDAFNLKAVAKPQNHQAIVACIAAWAGDVRLIDNLELKGD